MGVFPCSFNGVLTLSLSWTLLEFPVNMIGLVSIRDLHFKMDSQFINLCLKHSDLPAVDCVAEITETLDDMIEERCVDLSHTSTGGDIVQIENASLWRFRTHVSSALSLGLHFDTTDLNNVWALIFSIYTVFVKLCFYPVLYLSYLFFVVIRLKVGAKVCRTILSTTAGLCGTPCIQDQH